MNTDSREEAGSLPCLIVAHGDAVYASQLSRAFRRLGWDVYLARSGPEARRLARLLSADLMVMGTDLDEESGWLTCEKVTHEVPHVKVILIGDASIPRSTDFALFVGAVALVPPTGSVPLLVEEICGRSLPAAG